MNDPTLYEIAAIHPDGRRVLVVYTARRSRSGLLKACRESEQAQAIVALCQCETWSAWPKAEQGMKCGEWSIRFTGRTRKDAKAEGELPFILDPATLKAGAR